MIDEFKQAVEFLSQKLGPSTDKVYELAVRQVYVDATIAIVGTAALLAVGGVLFHYGQIERKKNNYNNDSPGFYIGAGFAVFLAAVVFFANNTLTALFNPEYYALTKLFSLVK